jgi:hypothetical protein
MSNYTFLTKNNNEGETIYYAIPADKIETLNLFETYDGRGQLVGHTNAGDYHLDNSDGTYATTDCIKAIAEKFGIDYDNIHIVNESKDEFKIEAGDGEEYGFDEDAVNDFIKEWRDENESLVEVKGFTYWDGHNWKTVTTSVNFGEPTHEVVSDGKLAADLNAAIENKSFEKSGFGCKVYSHENWVVINSNRQGTWAAFEIMSVQDYVHVQPNSSALPALEK